MNNLNAKKKLFVSLRTSLLIANLFSMGLNSNISTVHTELNDLIRQISESEDFEMNQ